MLIWVSNVGAHDDGKARCSVAIQVVCVACGCKSNAPDNAAGMPGKCPHCGAVHTIPSRSAGTPTEPPRGLPNQSDVTTNPSHTHSAEALIPPKPGTRQLFLVTTSGMFVAMCLFGGLVWLVYGVWARAAQKELAAKAVVELAKSNLVRLKTALESYSHVHDELPPLAAWEEALKADEQTSLTDLAGSKFYTPAETKRIANSPRLQFTDPWGSPCRLRYADVEFGFGSYDITSFGPDKKEGTDDDITEHGYMPPARYPRGS